MASNQVILFVHGAWHGPKVFETLRGKLESAGYSTQCFENPSAGQEPVSGIEADVDAIHHNIRKIIDAGKDVIVFMHSYGSVPGSDACKGLDKAARKSKGKKGGITGLIFCCSFLLPEGKLGGQPLPWFNVAKDGLTVWTAPGEAEKLFFNDLEASEADKWVKAMRPHSYKTFFSKTTYAAYKNIPSTYFLCTNDNSLPFENQQKMVAESGANFTTVTFDASHSPFLSKPDEVFRAVQEAAQRYRSV
ncbi:hypothetical protein TCE0_044f16035 [Talaromyces pinophilus]|uniref:AB hydrolase-1 domain-containing protein n=1 Tax=Talaromyces pinophilus TaxID=128442 RepID=A0A478EBX3_TALPI|nr:hypothetical protein TCE0_044f16035 [Talaromyces pinophilus]